jgi:hypothetical protein
MRPSLVGTVARTAVIAGTATAVSGKVAANQAAKAQAAAPPPAAAPAAAPPVAEAPAAPAAGGLTDELIDQLKKLGELRDAGILTDEEFQAKKGQLLGI